jgi:hypothetical protein
MARWNIKLDANFQPDLSMYKEFIAGSLFGGAVKMRQTPMDKGIMDNSIESFLQR